MTFLPSTSRRAVLSGLGAGAVSVGLAGCSDLAKPSVPVASQLLVWAPNTYFSPALTSAFTQIASLEIVQASSPASADLIVATHDRIDALRNDHALLTLDPRRLSGVSDIDPIFLRGRFASSPAFALPFGWQVTGLGYRRSKVDDIPDSWNDIYASARYPGRTGLSQDPLLLIRAGAKSLGSSFNEVGTAVADRVALLILSQRRAAGTAVNRDAPLSLLHGDLDLVTATSAEVAFLQERDSDLGFAVPREGGLVTTELLAIGYRARNPDGAYSLLNFLLQPNTAAAAARARHMVPTSVVARQQVICTDPAMAVYARNALSHGSEDDLPVTTAQRTILRAAAAVAVA